jgi:hypothetical protein
MAPRWSGKASSPAGLASSPVVSASSPAVPLQRQGSISLSALGDSSLHLTAARYFWKTVQDYGNAQKHFVRALVQAEENVGMLQEWMESVYAHEHDLLLARAVLQYLSCENLGGANVIFSRCKGALDTPLLNFCQFCTCGNVVFGRPPRAAPAIVGRWVGEGAGVGGGEGRI